MIIIINIMITTLEKVLPISVRKYVQYIATIVSKNNNFCMICITDGLFHIYSYILSIYEYENVSYFIVKDMHNPVIDDYKLQLAGFTIDSSCLKLQHLIADGMHVSMMKVVIRSQTVSYYYM